MGICGVYMINETKTGKVYFGSSIDIRSRWRRHNWELLKGIHSNKILQRAFNKYGQEYFKYSVIELVDDKDKLREVEQLWLNIPKKCIEFRLICANHMLDVGNPNLLNRRTGTYTVERRRNQSEMMKGNTYAAGKSHSPTAEIRKQISEKLKGTRHSDESYKKQSETNKGRKVSDQARINMSNAHKLRYKWIKAEKIPKRSSWGEGAFNAKLNDKKVIDIRNRYLNGDSVTLLSKDFCVGTTTIRSVIKRQIWKHVI